MVIVTFSEVDQVFSLPGQLVTYTGSSTYSRIGTNFSWYTPVGKNDVDFDGVGFTYSVDFKPTGGTVTQFRLDLDNDSERTPELSITGLSFDLALLARVTDNSLTIDQENDLIWRTVLAGDDIVNFSYAKTTAYVFFHFGGDGREIGSGVSIRGGNDVMTGDPKRGYIQGDVSTVSSGAVVFGGNDKMHLTGGGHITGDAIYVGGFLHGGDDRVSVVASGVRTEISGDASSIHPSGVVIGGNDRLVLSSNDIAFGDAVDVYGVLVAGKDAIAGGEGDNFIYGDVSTVYFGATMQGGDDTIHGRDGADTIYGDWETLRAGGHAWGGADILYGDAGSDKLYGNDGDDKLNGGSEDDTLTGGVGHDTFVFTDRLTVGKRSNVDSITDFNTADDRAALNQAIFEIKADKSHHVLAAQFKDIGVSGAKLDADDRIIFNHNTGDLSYDPDGSGKAAAVLFAHLDNKAALTADDFLVV